MPYPKILYWLMTTWIVSCPSCSQDDVATGEDPVPTGSGVTVDVDSSLFLESGLVENITTEPCTLSDGTETTCYRIKTTSVPTDHVMGPWCPTNISDGPEAGGIWFENGEVYDVDGAFIEGLAEFYDDPNWRLYDENGDIYVTDTQEACEAAANPNVPAEYQNHCVYCEQSYFDDVVVTYLIPITPVKLDNPDPTGGARGPGGGGVIGTALNGVNFDPPAPTEQILGAYTIAALDDNGGHVNPATGYHYHAATGMTTVVAQSDGHAGLIGYAMDGFGIYEQINEGGAEPSDLDECRGHTDDTRGYHYHVATPGTNSFIGCFSGAQGSYVAE